MISNCPPTCKLQVMAAKECKFWVTTRRPRSILYKLSIDVVWLERVLSKEQLKLLLGMRRAKVELLLIFSEGRRDLEDLIYCLFLRTEKMFEVSR
jgi:hypothetical protein